MALSLCNVDMLRQQMAKRSVQLLVPGEIIADVTMVGIALAIHHNSKLFLVIISIVSLQYAGQISLAVVFLRLRCLRKFLWLLRGYCVGLTRG